jgi:RES domain-containing protein
MPEAWRITKAEHAGDPFSGEGAWLYGGRWNNKGTRMVCTASSISLALLEVLVHLEEGEELVDYFLFSARFDDSLVSTLDVTKLRSGWASGAPIAETQEIGDRWVRGKESVVLEVPSAIVPQESNYLLNPEHRDFCKVERGEAASFPIDERLAKK